LLCKRVPSSLFIGSAVVALFIKQGESLFWDMDMVDLGEWMDKIAPIPICVYQFLYCLWLIRVTWDTYHDCDHICITPMVDHLLLWWFMRCKLLVVLDVQIDVYGTSFRHAFFWSN
jgi:hypothetical protein